MLVRLARKIVGLAPSARSKFGMVSPNYSADSSDKTCVVVAGSASSSAASYHPGRWGCVEGNSNFAAGLVAAGGIDFPNEYYYIFTRECSHSVAAKSMTSCCLSFDRHMRCWPGLPHITDIPDQPNY